MGFRLSLIKRRSDFPFRVLVCLDSIMVTGFVQRRRCLSGKSRTSSFYYGHLSSGGDAVMS